MLGPGRATQVAGVEAAIWAETISGFDDLSFLLLPRLAGVAHKAWSAPRLASWPAHRDRLARHGRLWAQDGLTYFRASTVDWALPCRGPDILALDQAIPSRGHAAVPSSRDRDRPGSGPR